MKKSIFMLIVVICLSVVNVFASAPEVKEPKPAKAIVVQVFNMLGEKLIPDEIRGSKAEVRVAVANGNYLRILSIETENEALAKFIRTSIDFKKLTKGTYEQGVVYRIPIEVRK